MATKNGSLSEEDKEYKRNWYQKNKSKCIEQARNSRIRRRKEGRDWYQLNKDKVRLYNQNHKFKTNYGLTLEEYNVLFEIQQGVCAICEKPETAHDERVNKPRFLSVDHNHRTGKIRGLLCGKCNTALGSLKENTDTMSKMILYVNKFK